MQFFVNVSPKCKFNGIFCVCVGLDCIRMEQTRWVDGQLLLCLFAVNSNELDQEDKIRLWKRLQTITWRKSVICVHASCGNIHLTGPQTRDKKLDKWVSEWDTCKQTIMCNATRFITRSNGTFGYCTYSKIAKLTIQARQLQISHSHAQHAHFISLCLSLSLSLSRYVSIYIQSCHWVVIVFAQASSWSDIEDNMRHIQQQFAHKKTC